MQVDEFKTLVKELHRNGIEVILDVVFNHTAEGNEDGPTISFRGLDNRTYYMLTPEGRYYNFSGCGNTLNCNHPVVRDFVLDCLRYWVAEYHIDGFRFDLASILGRDANGAALPNPPLLESLAADPVLGTMQADRRGLGRRRPLPGRHLSGLRALGRVERPVPRLSSASSSRATRDRSARWPAGCAGSPDLYAGAGAGGVGQLRHLPRRLHPGRPGQLQRQAQRGQRRGQPRRRQRQQQLELRRRGPHGRPGGECPAPAAGEELLLPPDAGQGVPMVAAGDEVRRTQRGNNNAYCQDNETSGSTGRASNGMPTFTASRSG